MKSKKSNIKLSDERKQRGRIDRSVMFPVAPPPIELPKDYFTWLETLKQNIRVQRLKTIIASNQSLILVYWDIGQSVLEKQEAHGWGLKIIDRLAHNLREQFPEMKGFSPRNLKYMRAFAKAWPHREIVQETLAQLTWYHNIALLEKLKTAEERLWYAQKAYEFGWSRNILAFQIEAKAKERTGRAQNNFPNTLPALDSDMAV